jgi:ADP-L-glycero-D-manno-heptose 6-epimerase
MKNILITGTKGFIGKNLAYELSDLFLIHEINEDIFESDNWGDTLLKKLQDIDPDVIFHIGACSDTLETDVNYMMIRNFEFTKILSEYSFTSETKLIYSSSAANYGTNNLYPSNLYGWSKYVAEQFVIQNGGIALRYFNVYGPGESNKGRMASVAYQMLEKIRNGEEVKLFPGEPKRDFVYIKDVISANIFAYKNYDDLVYEYYDVGCGESRTFEDVMNILELPYTYYREDEVPLGYQFFTQSNKEKWMPGWYPEYTLEMGLKNYIENINGENILLFKSKYDK